jgi:tRNA(Met) cytidine acetyltransferase
MGSDPQTDIVAVGDALLRQAAATRQRRLLVVSGEISWCRQQAQRLLAALPLERALWLTDQDRAEAEVVTGKAVRRLLGQERDAVVFDAHAGLDADALGAVSGIIRGGGLLIVLCPPLAQWPNMADPATASIATYPYAPAELGTRFLTRLVALLRTEPGITLFEQRTIQPGPLPVVNSVPAALATQTDSDKVFRTADQLAAVEAIEHVVEGHRRRPAVIVADRGRGKSAALGIAAARLLQRRAGMHIVVTAPRRDAVDSLFVHAQHLLPDAVMSEGSLHLEDASIEFCPPDELCLNTPSADLVLVDEAAAIPVALLQQMLSHYSRIAFATTVHGYEGTGRGFALRFRQILETQTPGWRELYLHTPIRWADNDPLERFVFRALLLDADAAEDSEVAAASTESVQLECLDRDALLDDEQLLGQLFGLLVVAHYRTTPNDLRALLDSPAIAVYVARYRGQVVATALLSREGELDAAMSDAIYAGQRRPHGHLIPQSLLAHAGIRAAGALRFARVMRIAVHPKLQGQGLGSQLLAYLRQQMTAQDGHLLGASFGATPALLRFWHRQGLLPVRVGFRRDHASGEHSVMVLASLSAEGDAVYRAARGRLCEDLPHWLSDPLRALDARVAAQLLQRAEDGHALQLNGLDRQVAQDFANGARSFEDSLASLWRLSVIALANPACNLNADAQTVLIAKVLQKRSWRQLSRLAEVSGRGAALQLLRQAVRTLIPFGSVPAAGDCKL